MELRHLRAYVTVAELRSFRQAAARLHLSQPPLSRQIQALEADLGVRLLERGSRREVTLTEAGRVFLGDAKKALGVLEGARRRVREFDQRTRNKLVIGNYSECRRCRRGRCPGGCKHSRKNVRQWRFPSSN